MAHYDGPDWPSSESAIATARRNRAAIVIEWKRGDIAVATEGRTFGSSVELTAGHEYVVNGLKESHGAVYLRILGDDGRGHDFLHSMFQRKN